MMGILATCDRCDLEWSITREELMENLRSALKEALEMNRADAVAATRGEYEEVSLQV